MAATLSEQDLRAHFNTKGFLKARALIEYRQSLIRSMLGDQLVPSLLDIGCGDGTISRLMIEAGAQATLIDLSDEMLATATSVLSPELRKNVRAIRDDFTNRNDLGEFSLVLCIGVLAYVHDVSGFIAALAAHVAPGGRCVLQLTDTATLSGRLLKAYSNLRGGVRKGEVAGRLTWMDRNQIAAICAQYSLRIIDFRTHAPIPPGGNYLPASVLRRMMTLSSSVGLGSECYLLMMKD